jgi:hypothetical protein
MEPDDAAGAADGDEEQAVGSSKFGSLAALGMAARYRKS